MESPSYPVQLSSEQARQSLQQANITFMNLMLGSEGIRTSQSTPDECCQMIDGCLTAGITDKLYGFPDQSPALQVMAATLNGIKRDHALLAIEFYAVGYLNMHDNSNRNTPARFNELCGLAFQNGSIFEYKNRLEDEIKRASQPLRYAHFGIGVAPAVAPSVAQDATNSSAVATSQRPSMANILAGAKKAASPPPPAAVSPPPPRAMDAGLLAALSKNRNDEGVSVSPPSVIEVPVQNNATPPPSSAVASSSVAAALVNNVDFLAGEPNPGEDGYDSDYDPDDWK